MENANNQCIVIAISQASKTYEFIKPTILQDLNHIVVTDPSDELYAKAMGLPRNKRVISPEEETKNKAKWDAIYADVSKVLRELNRALSSDESLELAKDFFYEAYPYDYLYYRCQQDGQHSIEAFDFKKNYGAEPFFFDENNHVISINTPVFKSWVEDLIEMNLYSSNPNE